MDEIGRGKLVLMPTAQTRTLSVRPLLFSDATPCLFAHATFFGDEMKFKKGVLGPFYRSIASLLCPASEAACESHVRRTAPAQGPHPRDLHHGRRKGKGVIRRRVLCCVLCIASLVVTRFGDDAVVARTAMFAELWRIFTPSLVFADQADFRRT